MLFYILKQNLHLSYQQNINVNLLCFLSLSLLLSAYRISLCLWGFLLCSQSKLQNNIIIIRDSSGAIVYIQQNVTVVVSILQEQVVMEDKLWRVCPITGSFENLMKECICKADVIHVGLSASALVCASRSPVASSHCTLPNVKPVLLHASFKTAKQAENYWDLSSVYMLKVACVCEVSFSQMWWKLACYWLQKDPGMLYYMWWMHSRQTKEILSGSRWHIFSHASCVAPGVPMSIDI